MSDYEETGKRLKEKWAPLLDEEVQPVNTAVLVESELYKKGVLEEETVELIICDLEGRPRAEFNPVVLPQADFVALRGISEQRGITLDELLIEILLEKIAEATPR